MQVIGAVSERVSERMSTAAGHDVCLVDTSSVGTETAFPHDSIDS